MPATDRILVTGGRGFVGSHLLPRLRAAFPQAEIFTPDATALDVTDAAAVDAAVAAFRPDACIHLAAIAAIPEARRDPERAWRVNLHGTLALADAMRRRVPESRLIYPSSADAYGRSFKLGRPVDETVALAPINLYGATKAAAEMALSAMAAEGFPVVVLRPFNHTGAGQTAQYAVPAFARQIARIEAGLQENRIVVGALDPMRDFLDVRDICDAYVAAVSRSGGIAPGTVLNIASGVPRRIGTVLEQLITLAGVAARVETGGALLRPSDIPTASGDATAARTALDWTPRIAWDTTLRDVLDDWRARVRCDPTA